MGQSKHRHRMCDFQSPCIFNLAGRDLSVGAAKQCTYGVADKHVPYEHMWCMCVFARCTCIVCSRVCTFGSIVWSARNETRQITMLPSRFSYGAYGRLCMQSTENTWFIYIMFGDTSGFTLENAVGNVLGAIVVCDELVSQTYESYYRHTWFGDDSTLLCRHSRQLSMFSKWQSFHATNPEWWFSSV